MIYLMGQKLVGQNCRNFGLVSKILSEEIFCLTMRYKKSLTYQICEYANFNSSSEGTQLIVVQ